MNVLSLRSVAKSFGAAPLFRNLALSIGPRDRIGLVGANGTGKSTLLKIIAGLEAPDAGERVPAKGARLACLAQEDVFPAGWTVEEIAAEGLRGQGRSETEVYTRVGEVLGRAGFVNFDERADNLSGGRRKRLALARELVKEPDLLLLDEPTNHLDLDSILWLETLLPSLACAVVVVSHDRCFLENVTNRTIELGKAYPDGLLDVDGPYGALREAREAFLRNQAGLEESLANKARREVEWLRRGPKARTSKAKYRKDEAERLLRELSETRRRNAETGRAGIDFTGGDRKTKRLLSVEGLGKRMGGRRLFSGLDLVLSPGLCLGVCGPNGSGKTTLLRMLAGEEEPDEGRVRRAPGLRVVVFDQHREELDREATLRRALSPHGDSVVYRGRSLHVVSWAKRFLFRPEQLDLPVGLLSGGEQARILIARLMLRPADVLLLDEPTNNLDIPTLEVLEESLLDFPGAVVLISHDRSLMDAAADLAVGLDGRGGAVLFADYAQWAKDRRERERVEAKAPKAEASPQKQRPGTGAKKLSYLEQREWDGMEERILEAEERLEAAKQGVEAAASDAAALPERLNDMEAAQADVDALYARWEELEAKQAPPG